MITDRRRVAGGTLLPLIARAVEAGVDMVQIREKDLAGRPLEALVEHAVALARGSRTGVLVNDRLDLALAAGAGGVHLPVAGLPVRAVRRAAPEGFRIGASAHNLEEARAAAGEGADFLVFGPVFETTSKTVYRPPLGLEALAKVVQEVKVPVFALGGIRPEAVPAVAATGAAGVAGISAFASEESLSRLLAALRAVRDEGS